MDVNNKLMVTSVEGRQYQGGAKGGANYWMSDRLKDVS